MNQVSREVPAWLARAADDPQECLAIWSSEPRVPQTLATGRTFDAVSVDYRVGVETVSLLRELSVDVCPALVDYARRRVAFLIPVGSSRSLCGLVTSVGQDRPDYRYLGQGSFVVVAGPAPMPGDRFEWVAHPSVPPEKMALAAFRLMSLLTVAGNTVELAKSFGGSRGEGRFDV